jgi:transposase
MLHLRNTGFIPLSEPVRQLRGATDLGKRRVFTAEEKARIVAESFATGESVCYFARRHGLMAAQLFAWRKNARLQREQGGLSAYCDKFPGLSADLAGEAQASAQVAPIEIVIGAVIVRVPQGFDVATLKAVLQTLNAGLAHAAR